MPDDTTSATGGYLPPGEPRPRSQVEDLLHDLIAGITGLPDQSVRPRWQADPPKQPPLDADWCAFGVVGRETPQYPQVVHDGEGEGSGRVLVHEQLRIVASFYGPRAEELAVTLRAGLMIPQNREPLFRAGMGLVEVGALAYVPELTNARWRPRCDVPLIVAKGPDDMRPAIKNIADVDVDIDTDGGTEE